MYSVIIAERNEADLENTIANIDDTQDNAEIMVVHDEKGKGCQYCRHEGIMAVDTDIVIITDGHMRFKKNHLDEMADYIRDNPRHIACAKCHHNAEQSFDDSPYCGADIVWKSDERNQKWILPSKWRSDSSTGEIACVLGACYAMSRDRYINVLKAPWQYGKGWGMDEEVISIVNWLCGGMNVLLEQDVAHLCRSQSDVPYEIDINQACGIWANRFQLIEMLPLSDEDRKDLTGHLERNKIVVEQPRKLFSMVDYDAMKVLRDYYGTQERTMENWKDKFINNTEVKVQKIGELRKMCKKAGITPPRTATKQDLNRLLNAPKQRQPNIVIKDKGIPCNHCGHKYDHKVTHTFPNGKHRRLCGACNKPFVTIREE